MKTEFAEVRCNYFNEDFNCWTVDAWKTDDGDEEGEVVAYIYPNTKEVKIVAKCLEDEYVLEVIKEKLKEILSEE